jgi:hypothetical protein
MLLLTACASQSGTEALAPSAMRELASASVPVEPAPAPAEPEPPAEIEISPPAQLPEPPPPPMPTDAQSLRAAFGAPAFIRRESDSELWRYDGAGCAAFFFLYPEDGTYRVRHAETSPRGELQADPDCLRSLIVPAGGGPSTSPR